MTQNRTAFAFLALCLGLLAAPCALAVGSRPAPQPGAPKTAVLTYQIDALAPLMAQLFDPKGSLGSYLTPDDLKRQGLSWTVSHLVLYLPDHYAQYAAQFGAAPPATTAGTTPIPLSVRSYASGVGVSDPALLLVTYRVSAAPVPEASTASMLVVALPALFWFVWRRRIGGHRAA